jgi:hypothetical protein
MGAGIFSGTTSCARVNVPFFTRITVTPFWGMRLPWGKLMDPVTPARPLVDWSAVRMALGSAEPARVMESASSFTVS